MPTPNESTVTAQDIFSIFDSVDICYEIDENGNGWIDGHFYDGKLVKELDALLSRARQEARREALKEMDEAYQCPSDYGQRMKLRQEYQQPN